MSEKTINTSTSWEFLGSDREIADLVVFYCCCRSLGPVDAGTVEKVEVEITDVEKERLSRVEARPPLSEILNLHDFEAIAKLVMPEKAWAYYSSAADDEITNRENHMAYHR